MVFIYLSLGIALVLLLHLFMQWYARAEIPAIRRAFRWVFIAGILVLVFLLLRFGLLHMAAIVSFLSVVIPLLQKFQANKGAKRASPPPPRPGSNRMSQTEARNILGIDENADRKEILAAHKRMIQKNHPDQGGSSYLAGKINEARDTLLND